MRPGSVFGLTTLGLVSRTSMDDRLGDGPPLWEGEQQFHEFLGYALFTSMAAACAHSVSHSSRERERASTASAPHAIDALRRRRAESRCRGPLRPLFE